MTFRIEPKDASHDDAVVAFWRGHYNGTTVVSRGVSHDARHLPGFVAVEEGKVVGALTFHRVGDQTEVVSLDSFAEDKGVGTALLAAAVEDARGAGARRIWLITSNDNIRSIRFYQKRGWALAALYPNAIAQARLLKPEIPLIGEHGIPIRDELELELIFAS